MATWNVYVELEGYPLYVDIELPDEYDEQDAWEAVHNDLIIEVTKED